MPNRRSRYISEFRTEAVRLYRSVKGEKSMRQVATAGSRTTLCAPESTRRYRRRSQGRALERGAPRAQPAAAGAQRCGVGEAPR